MTNTNLFETGVGALNIAPTKISGQYKIVFDVNNIRFNTLICYELIDDSFVPEAINDF